MRALLALVAAVGLVGCATDYVARTSTVRNAYEGYNHAQALQVISQLAKETSEIDRLLYLLDQGMLLHASGQYAESVKVLAEADRLSALLDVTSVSEEAATLVTNERHRAYRGEDFEKLMISVLQALNYAKLGNEEGALVEVRRVNERLQKMVRDEKKPYEQLAIARYLGGVFYEDQGEWDSAIIDYQQAHQLQPSLGHLAEPLLRLAKKTGREDLYQQLKARYPEVAHEPLAPNEGQLLVLVEAGRSPEKVSHQRQQGNAELDWVVVPSYVDRGSAPRAKVAVGEEARPSVTVTSLRSVAKQHLEDRIGRMLARSLASTAVKAGLAAGAGALTKSEEVGALTFYLLLLTNQPDLRSWLSLPQEFQLARFRLPEGTHTVKISARGKTTTHQVQVTAQRIALVIERRY